MSFHITIAAVKPSVALVCVSAMKVTGHCIGPTNPMTLTGVWERAAACIIVPLRWWLAWPSNNDTSDLYNAVDGGGEQ